MNRKLLIVLILCLYSQLGVIYVVGSGEIAGPVYRGAGIQNQHTNPITLTLPAGTANGDLLISFIETGGQAVTMTGTWAELSCASAQTGSSCPGTNCTELTVFWMIRGVSPPIADDRKTNDSGNHQQGTMVAIVSGTFDSADPFDESACSTTAYTTFGKNVNMPAVTPSNAPTLIVHSLSGADPDTLSDNLEFTGWTNGNLDNLSERLDYTSNRGDGGALAVVTGDLPDAESTLTTVGTATNNSHRIYSTFAINPVP